MNMPTESIFDHDERVDVADAHNFIDFYARLGAALGAQTEPGDCFSRVIGEVPHPYFNFVHSFETRTCGGDLDVAVNRALAAFRSRNCPMMWIVFPALDPESDRLIAQLSAAGLELFADRPGMAIDLTAFMPALAAPADLSIERVTDGDVMREWVDVQAQCDDGVVVWIKEVRVRYACLRGFDPDSPQQIYLGRYCGKPVGCSILHLAAGVAGIYQVATLPEARRHGIGRAMTVHALLEGRERGFRAAALHASAMGINTYRSIGFRDRSSSVKVFLKLPSR